MDVRKLAQNHIEAIEISGLKLEILEETLEYFCFSYSHPTLTLAGAGPTFIDKIELRFFEYGSGDSDPKANFIKKIKTEKLIRKTLPEFDILKSYNLNITKIFRKMNLIEKLMDLNLAYTIPEIVGKDIFRISKPYNSNLIEKRLTILPCKFSNIPAEKLSNLIISNKEIKLIEFTITEFEETTKTNRVEKSTDEDLLPTW
ncbi:hypothetical protein [Nonlabens sp. Asnod3-A02]|uniref:hypothetical protein n=1 Tax=Nonlabens sp. Asnod3-A02 TaxID=3160579 RepID=UPI0038689BE8